MWTVVFSDRAEPIRVEFIGRAVMLDLKAWSNGRITATRYDITGICPRQRVAFAGYPREVRS